MPDFSNNPGGTGGGASAINAHYYITVLEEYATGQVSASFTLYLPNPTLSKGDCGLQDWLSSESDHI